MKTVRWGIIGVGDVTEIKSGPAFYKTEHSELVAVMRRTGEKAKDFAERHNVPYWYDDADAIIHHDEVDAVYIATPQNSHKDYAIKVAQAGKPVYVEKPMGMSYAECKEMLDACEKAGTPIWVGYYRRAMPRFLKIKELLDSGAIGDILSLSIRLYKRPVAAPGTPHESLPWYFRPEISGGGQFMDMGCHQIDLANYYLGSIKEVKAFARNQTHIYPSADTVSASFVFESGVLGSGIWAHTTGLEVDVMEFVGSKGLLRFPIFDPSPFTLINEAGEQTIDIGYEEHVHQPLVKTIIAELRGEGRCPSTGQSASHTNWVLDQILSSFQG
jgi:predicted dehydrogenase